MDFTSERFQSTPPVWGATKAESGNCGGKAFQSTPPVWGATCLSCEVFPRRLDFNPRPPCGERPPYVIFCSGKSDFNPRPPCGERLCSVDSKTPAGIFQSTPPVWGATRICFQFQLEEYISIHAPRVGSDYEGMSNNQLKIISIHAPRVGSDFLSPVFHPSSRNFNPRPPCGERPDQLTKGSAARRFQSTPPVWGAT